MGYWNKIRQDFPEVFEKRAKLERDIGASIIKGVYLDELEPTRGTHRRRNKYRLWRAVLLKFVNGILEV